MLAGLLVVGCVRLGVGYAFFEIEPYGAAELERYGRISRSSRATFRNILEYPSEDQQKGMNCHGFEDEVETHQISLPEASNARLIHCHVIGTELPS